MRTARLLLLAILFPALAHAADPPTLTVYTLSHDTIYPTATAESGLSTTTAIDTAFSEQVKASIKIVSASGATIKSLYTSSSVTNPAPKIWDGTNTAGTQMEVGNYTVLISATSTATNLSMTDSSRTITIASPAAPGEPPPVPPEASSDETNTVPPSSSSGPPEYLPIPTLRIVTSGDRVVSSGADVAFTAVVYDSKANRRDDAVVTWSFGDGMRKLGASVLHKYYGPGEYLAVVHATTADGGNAFAESVVTVKDASIKIASLSARGITLVNNDSRTLDLSLWRLSMGGQEFKIPEDTQILAGHTILFPSQVIELPTSDSALLLYPSGEVAAAYPPVARQGAPIPQPSSNGAGYEQVQSVEPSVVSKAGQIISAKTSPQAHVQEISAPAAASELAAAGAASPLSGMFKSPWTLGFLGVVVLAGSAFIFL